MRDTCMSVSSDSRAGRLDTPRVMGEMLRNSGQPGNAGNMKES